MSATAPAEFLPYVIALEKASGQRIARFASLIDADAWAQPYSLRRCGAPLFVVDTSQRGAPAIARWMHGEKEETPRDNRRRQQKGAP